QSSPPLETLRLVAKFLKKNRRPAQNTGLPYPVLQGKPLISTQQSRNPATISSLFLKGAPRETSIPRVHPRRVYSLRGHLLFCCSLGPCVSHGARPSV